MSKRNELLTRTLIDIMSIEGDDFIEADGTLSYKGFNQKTVDAYRKKNKLPPINVKELKFGDFLKMFEDEFVNVNGIKNLPDDYIPVVADFAFNSGSSNAVKTLQNLVGTKADGIIGNKTISAINKRFKSKQDFINGISDARINFINNASLTNPNVLKFQNGIINRVNTVRERELKKYNP